MPLDLPGWQNGNYCKVKDIFLPVIDFGFIHCDSTYDAIAYRNNNFVNLDEHLDRFYDGCDSVRLKMPYDRAEVKTVLNTLASQSTLKESIVFIVITRGIAKNGPRDLITPVPNVFFFVRPYAQFKNNNTATLCLANTIRNDSIDQRVKNFAWNDLTLAQFEANDRGYDSSVLLSREGYLTEGPAFNIALIKDGNIKSPKSVRLTGTVMEQVKRYCEKNGIIFEYCDILPTELETADAVFLTSTGGNVILVTKYENTHYVKNDVLEILRTEIC
jgi:branched-chain amino acid aminotransferase